MSDIKTHQQDNNEISQMSVTHVIIPGKPLVWSRPRVVSRNGAVRLFDPKLAARKKLSLSLKQYFPKPIEGPIKMEMYLYHKAPRKAARGTWKVTRFDLDNALKALCDVLTNVAYLDDAQVASLIAQKKWGEQDETHLFITAL